MPTLVFILVFGSIQKNFYPFFICPSSLGVLIFKPTSLIPSVICHCPCSFSLNLLVSFFLSCSLVCWYELPSCGSHSLDSSGLTNLHFISWTFKACWDPIQCCFVLCCVRTQMAPSPKQLWCRVPWPKKDGNSSRPSGKLRWILFPWDSTNIGLILCLMVGPYEGGVDFKKKSDPSGTQGGGTASTYQRFSLGFGDLLFPFS